MKPSQRPVQPGRDAILAENTQMVEDSKFVNYTCRSIEDLSH